MRTDGRMALVIVSLLVVAGCTTIRGSSRGNHQLKRHLNAWETVVNTRISKVHSAVEAGLKDLAIRPLTSRSDELTGVVDGTLADGSDFVVKLEALGETVTKISVRCGMLGDRERSTRLFRAIEKRL